MNPILVEFVTCGEERDIDRITDAHGNTLDLVPVPNSERYFLIVKMPDGVNVKAYVSSDDYEKHVSRVPASPVADDLLDV